MAKFGRPPKLVCSRQLFGSVTPAPTQAHIDGYADLFPKILLFSQSNANHQLLESIREVGLTDLRVDEEYLGKDMVQFHSEMEAIKIPSFKLEDFSFKYIYDGLVIEVDYDATSSSGAGGYRR